MTIRLLVASAIMAVTLLLCGCITPGPSTRFYQLDPVVEPAPPKPQTASERVAKPATVVIKDLRLPLYLDRPQIVTRNDGNRLELNEFEQWGGPLREEMTRVLVTNLGRLLGGDRVVAAPYYMATLPDYRVEVDILGFERIPGGRVRLSAQWWVTRGADATLAASSEGTFSGEPLAADVTYEKLVGSMSAVYGELAQAIARSIRPRVAGNP